jgi:uncharacterized protein (TIGR02246 family)
MTDKAEIVALLERYERALNAGNAGGAASCFAVDAIFMPASLPTVRGRAIPVWYQEFFKSTSMDVAFAIDEIAVADTVAYALTRSDGTQTRLATAVTSPKSNRELFIFTKEDGTWRIARYLFNKPQ